MLVNVSWLGLVGTTLWLVKKMEGLMLVVSSPSNVLLFSNGGVGFFIIEMLSACKSLK